MCAKKLGCTCSPLVASGFLDVSAALVVKIGRSLPSYLDAAKSPNHTMTIDSPSLSALECLRTMWLDLLKSQHLSGVFLCTSTGRQGSQ